MGKRNRARSRAIRTEMARTGENYTRAAAEAADSPAGRTGRTPTDLVKDHIVGVLLQRVRTDDARFALAQELEQQGHRVIYDRMSYEVLGPGEPSAWQIWDWLTDELIAEGQGGQDGYAAAVKRLDPDGLWRHEDYLDDEVPVLEVSTPGVPVTLGRALDDWMAQSATTDEDIAGFIGWPVEKVREHRFRRRPGTGETADEISHEVARRSGPALRPADNQGGVPARRGSEAPEPTPGRWPAPLHGSW